MQARKSLLAVFPVAPWPVRDNGISVRFYPVLRSLAQDHDIDLVVLSDFRESLPDDELLRAVRSVDLNYFNRARPPSLWRRLWTLLKVLTPFGPPYEYASYYTKEVRNVLRKHASRHRYDTVLWVGPHYREALDQMRHAEFAGSRIVFDCVDSPLLHYVRGTKESDTRSLITRIDQWKTKFWERKLALTVDVSVYISPVDASAAFGDRKSPSVVVPNGVYLDDAPVAVSASSEGLFLGYLGHMGYTPNIEAAVRLHDEIFVPLKKEFPELKLLIIGRRPHARVRDLASKDVVVTGEVANIWEYIEKVSVFAFPLSSGAGLQNKLLEAMYAGRPVVASKICSRSLGAKNGVDILESRNSEEMLDHVRTLLREPGLMESIRLSGQRFVRENFEISRVVAQYIRLLFPMQ